MVVDVVGGDHPETDGHGEAGEGVVALGVEGVAVVPEFDDDAVAAEPVDQVGQPAGGGGGAVGLEGGGHGSLAAAGEEHPVGGSPGAGQLGQALEVQPGGALAAGQLGLGEGAAQPGVPVGTAGQHHEVLGGRVGAAGAGSGGEGEFGAEHGGEAVVAGGLGEPDHSVEAVVVGEGEGGQAQAGGLGDEFLRAGGAVEEAEARVAVQFGVGDGALHPAGRR